ncbi:MAG: hypothetical protein JWM90_3129, partial [Thermoleophilia bacterium]|nr:hypothetical protein [Thermoleophilia bacterium]
MKTYKGYEAQIEYDGDARLFHGSVPNIRSVITFAGDSVDELEQAFHDSVDCYLDLCERQGISPAKPYSGNFLIRVDPALHGRAAASASKAGSSLNAWMADAIEEKLERPVPSKARAGTSGAKIGNSAVTKSAAKRVVAPSV